MEKYTAVNDSIGKIKVASNGQMNEYTNTANGYEHTWYNPSGLQGWHGDSVTKDEKKFMADVTKR